ncbi:2-amino-4-hydroxy-6-hydroxymethyldihydropteridine diphosphokinase [Ligilactobacillus cholophilus]|uniref:2-amino-4-hydroxy-6- hydroxymethyldihydropteridine diphosphokinase n=1 Tax=Ligilactobacillus cholophilus TaxID=3050131 RepID=UPI0025B1A6B9|nr:2-amino-4-hydroxy-6-hydroxymethyldihydropteridine diphosphokinase [Ligilactobacillus cholophilus]
MEKLNIVYLGLGTNLGNKQQNLEQIIALLQKHDEIKLLKQSSVYETSPVGGVEQDNFYNMVIKIGTTFSAEQLLEIIHEVEKKLKRIRIIHWGPRTADVDILYFNEQQMNTEHLKVPHPEILNRLFVLVPLLEICGTDFYDYDRLVNARQALEDTSDQKLINRGQL